MPVGTAVTMPNRGEGWLTVDLPGQPLVFVPCRMMSSSSDLIVQPKPKRCRSRARVGSCLPTLLYQRSTLQLDIVLIRP